MHVCVVLKSTTIQDVSWDLAFWTELPLDLTTSLHRFISEMQGSKMEATSPHPQNHLGLWMSSYLLLQPPRAAWRDVKVLYPYSQSGTLLLPRECKLLASACFFPQLQCISKSARHLKDLSLKLSKGGMAGTVGKPWLQPWVWSGLGQYGSVSQIRPALGDTAPIEIQV